MTSRGSHQHHCVQTGQRACAAASHFGARLSWGEVCLLFSFLKFLAQKRSLTRNLATFCGHWPVCPKVTCLETRWGLMRQMNRAVPPLPGRGLPAWPGHRGPLGRQGRTLHGWAWIKTTRQAACGSGPAGLLSQTELLTPASWPATVTRKHGPVGREFGHGMGRSGFRGARGLPGPHPGPLSRHSGVGRPGDGAAQGPGRASLQGG